MLSIMKLQFLQVITVTSVESCMPQTYEKSLKKHVESKYIYIYHECMSKQYYALRQKFFDSFRSYKIPWKDLFKPTTIKHLSQHANI